MTKLTNNFNSNVEVQYHNETGLSPFETRVLWDRHMKNKKGENKKDILTEVTFGRVVLKTYTKKYVLWLEEKVAGDNSFNPFGATQSVELPYVKRGQQSKDSGGHPNQDYTNQS